MKKIGKIVFVSFVLLVIGYASYALFLAPKDFVSQEKLVESFVENIKRNDVCLTHMVSENVTYCENLTDLFQDKDSISIKSLEQVNDEVMVVLIVDEVEVPLLFTFSKVEVPGLRGFLNKYYYAIDYII